MTTTTADADRVRRWRRTHHVIWALLVVTLVVKGLLSPAEHTVFTKFAAGAEHWWDGVSLYDEYPDLGSFRYPPTFALIMVPFAALGDHLGGLVWVLLSLGVYAIGVRELALRIAGWGPDRVEFHLLHLAAVVGAIRPLWNAQSHVLVSGLLLWGCGLLLRGHVWRAAGLLVLPTFMKVVPLATVLLLVSLPAFMADEDRPRWRGGRQLALPALACVLLLAALPFACASPGYAGAQYAGWLDHIQSTFDRRWDSFRDVWTLWTVLSGDESRWGAYRAVQLLGALAALVWVRLHSRDAGDPRWPVLACLVAGGAWQMLFGPAVDYKSYVVIAPLTSWALVVAWTPRRSRLLVTGAWLLTSLLGAGRFERLLRPVTDLALTVLPVGTLLFLVWTHRHGERCLAETPAEGAVTPARPRAA